MGSKQDCNEYDELMYAIADDLNISGYKILKLQLQSDDGYGWSWHCNFAMAMNDCGVEHELANNIAADIMEKFFGINTRSLPEFQDMEEIWASNRTIQTIRDEAREDYEEIQSQRSRTELGVIRSIQFGLADRDEPCILMVVDSLSGESLLVFEGPDITKFVKQTNVTNINNLVGKVCVVEIKDHLMKFVEMFK